MRTISVIGIGAGNPEQLTLQAVEELNLADVFFVLDKGGPESGKRELTRLREAVLDRHRRDSDYRVVHAADPERDRNPDDYRKAVADWHQARVKVYEKLFIEELEPGERGAILVWGDPSLYDSTITLVEAVLARGNVRFGFVVVPGVTSISALAAAHRTTLNRIGEPVQITTGRRLAEGPLTSDAVVMLDANNTFTAYAGQDLDIFWGAYLGTPDEILVSGPIATAAPEIERKRAEARERKGWIMDTYLLRHRP